MKNHCAFSKNHSCPLWTDYELTCYELEEANSLCHSNWIEIERQYKYIHTLQKILSDNDIPTNMILTNYLRGPWNYSRPSNSPFKFVPQPSPSNYPLKNWHSKRASPSRLTLN